MSFINEWTAKAKGLFDKGDGTDAAAEDAKEVKDVAGKDESLTEKAEDSAEALKDPGAPGPGTPTA
jgi:hypothetical protein